MSTDDYAQPAATLNNGLMPLLGFGTWQLSNREAPQAIAHALQAGYRHIDTATAYHNESGIGKALASSTGCQGIGFCDDQAAAWSCRSRASNPRGRACPSWAWTTSTSGWCTGRLTGGQRREVWEQLVRARQDGLAKAVGVSNYSLAQIDELTEATGVTPEVNQIRWGPRSTTRMWSRGSSNEGSCWRDTARSREQPE